MIPRPNRLPVSRFSKAARFFKSPWCVVKQKANEVEHVRIGCVVAKRVDKRAVVRNRIRRLVLDTMFAHAQKDRGYDMLVVMKQNPFATNQESQFRSFLEQTAREL